MKVQLENDGYTVCDARLTSCRSLRLEWRSQDECHRWSDSVANQQNLQL